MDVCTGSAPGQVGDISGLVHRGMVIVLCVPATKGEPERSSEPTHSICTQSMLAILDNFCYFL